jgi:murein endopeptidase
MRRASLNGALVGLADDYAELYPGSKLYYNDASLVGGGLMDISGEWQNPHASHRVGEDSDVNLVQPSRRAKLRKLIGDHGLTILVHGSHWHLRQ